MQKKEKPREFTKLLHFSLSYFLIFLIPIITGVVSYANVLNITHQQTDYSATLIIENSMYDLERSLASIDSFAEALAHNSLVQGYVGAEKTSALLMIGGTRFTHNLPAYHDENGYVQSYYLYSEMTDSLVAPGQAFFNLALYYENYFDFGSMTYEYWHENILDDNTSSARIVSAKEFATSEHSIQLLYSIPFRNANKSKQMGRLLFVLDQNQIEATLRQAFDLGAESIEILNENDESIVSLAKSGGTVPTDSSRKNIAGIVVESPKYGFRYIVSIPQSYFLLSALDKSSFQFLITIIWVLLSIILIYAVYKYNQRPLIRVFQKMSAIAPANSKLALSERELRVAKKSKSKNELWYLFNDVSELIHQKNNLEEQILEQEQLQRESFFIQLVSGTILNEKDMWSQINKFGITPEGKQFRGVYIKFPLEQLTALEGGRYYLNEIIDISIVSRTSAMVPCYWASQNALTLLYITPDSGGALTVQELARDIYLFIQENYNMEIQFFVGAEYNRLPLTYLSFSEARRLLNNQSQTSTGGFFINEYTHDEQAGYRYTHADENQLLLLAEQGDYPAVSSYLRYLYDLNYLQKPLPANMSELLMTRMFSTLAGSPWNAFVSTDSDETKSRLAPGDFFAYMEGKYKLICEHNQVEQIEKQEKLENEIVQFINLNYSDTGLSLKQLSLQFGMTESYLSTLIKKLAGENFSAYLEKLRIERANQLLAGESLSIGEIAQRTGYESSTSFGRAYKRVMGISASQYRAEKQQ